MGNIKNKYKLYFILLLFLFIVLTIWRVLLIILPVHNLDAQVQIWAASYQIIAWFGAIVGLTLSMVWGGYKSILGRASLAFSLGLLAQSFGQSVFSYYYYSGTEMPYPSLADIGFFGSIPFYIYGIFLISKVSEAHLSLKSFSNKMISIIVPLILLIASYLVFLKGYQIDLTQKMKTFLDFGYPLGQAVYISMAILAYLLSRNTLGGIMRKSIIFFIAALVFQYVADYTFLYQSSRGIFVGGGTSDYIYLVSYFVMALSLIQLGIAFNKIKES